MQRFPAHDDPLATPLRRAMYDLLLAGGVLTAGQAARATGVTRATARYHLDILCRHRLAGIQRRGSRILYHPNGDGKCPRERALHSALGTPGAARLLRELADRPGASLRTLARTCGVSLATVHWHLSAFSRDGVVVRSSGCRVVYAIAPGAREALAAVAWTAQPSSPASAIAPA